MICRFEITFASKSMKEVSDLIRRLDAIQGHICIKETVEITLEEYKDPQDVKELLREAYEKLGCTVYDIKGGQFE